MFRSEPYFPCPRTEKKIFARGCRIGTKRWETIYLLSVTCKKIKFDLDITGWKGKVKVVHDTPPDWTLHLCSVSKIAPIIFSQYPLDCSILVTLSNALCDKHSRKTCWVIHKAVWLLREIKPATVRMGQREWKEEQREAVVVLVVAEGKGRGSETERRRERGIN